MTPLGTAVIETLGEFAGGRADIADELPRFGIAALLWLSLLWFSWRWRSLDPNRERWLSAAFLVGFIREALMFVVFFLAAWGYVEMSRLEWFFPPLEHALSQLAVFLICAGFVGYLKRDAALTRRLTGLSLLVSGTLYAVTSVAWVRIHSSNPTLLFGATWCDWAFRLTSCIAIGWALILTLKSKARHSRLLATALLPFFLDELLMLANLATNELYRMSFAPVRHSLHLIGVAMLAAVYITEEESRRFDAETRAEEQARRLERALESSVRAMSRTVEIRDRLASRHAELTERVADAIAVRLGHDKLKRQQLSIASLLHDIGNTGVPAEILGRPSSLSELEMALVRGHVALGADIVREAEFDSEIVSAVQQHHERLDGSGYPDGLRGDEVTEEARILAVADVVAAMLGHRPHRPACSETEVLAELAGGRGSRYDAAVVDAAVDALQSGSLNAALVASRD